MDERIILQRVDHKLQSIQERISWIETGKASKYREEKMTWELIASYAQDIQQAAISMIESFEQEGQAQQEGG